MDSKKMQRGDHRNSSIKKKPTEGKSHHPERQPAKAKSASPFSVKRPPGNNRDEGPSNKLRLSILRLLGQRPLDAAGIYTALDLPPAWKGKLGQLLKQMELSGDVARIRKDRYIIPKEADLFTGVIQFHASGAAHVLNEKAGEPDLYISGENTFTSMHGDRVVARVNGHGTPASFQGGGRQRKEGTVIRVLVRSIPASSKTSTSNLQKPLSRPKSATRSSLIWTLGNPAMSTPRAILSKFSERQGHPAWTCSPSFASTACQWNFRQRF
ncbi:MAG: hypothetical protein EBS96_05285 [Spartobacteria bacterium]|nr:hypothetical protein [Spartobacteria bacterium]